MKMPPLFSVEAFAEFLLGEERSHAGLDVLMPEKKGWQLSQELRGREETPVLFRMYSKGGMHLVTSSEYVNERLNSCSGASRTEWLRESDPKEKKKLKAHSWAQLIGQINATDFENMPGIIRRRPRSLLRRRRHRSPMCRYQRRYSRHPVKDRCSHRCSSCSRLPWAGYLHQNHHRDP